MFHIYRTKCWEQINCPVKTESWEVETMRRTELLPETRMMGFEEAYYGWQEQRLTQDEAACLPGICERAFRTHQERLPKEPALAGISDMEEANRYIAEIYPPACNEEFAASNDNRVSFESLSPGSV